MKHLNLSVAIGASLLMIGGVEANAAYKYTYTANKFDEVGNYQIPGYEPLTTDHHVVFEIYTPNLITGVAAMDSYKIVAYYGNLRIDDSWNKFLTTTVDFLSIGADGLPTEWEVGYAHGKYTDNFLTLEIYQYVSRYIGGALDEQVFQQAYDREGVYFVNEGNTFTTGVGHLLKSPWCLSPVNMRYLHQGFYSSRQKEN